MGKILYKQTKDGSYQFVGSAKAGQVRIPNYVYDLWLPLLGAEGIGVYTLYVRLQYEGSVKRVTLAQIAEYCRIGKDKLNDINEKLIKYGFIQITKPSGYHRLMHWTIEIFILEPPQRVSKEFIEEDAVSRRRNAKSGMSRVYNPVPSWLTQQWTEGNTDGTSERPIQVFGYEEDRSPNFESNIKNLTSATLNSNPTAENTAMLENNTSPLQRNPTTPTRRTPLEGWVLDNFKELLQRTGREMPDEKSINKELAKLSREVGEHSSPNDLAREPGIFRNWIKARTRYWKSAVDLDKRPVDQLRHLIHVLRDYDVKKKPSESWWTYRDEHSYG